MWQKHLLHWNEASDWLRKTRIGWGHLQREPLWRHHMVSVTWPQSFKNLKSQEKLTQTGWSFSRDVLMYYENKISILRHLKMGMNNTFKILQLKKKEQLYETREVARRCPISRGLKSYDFSPHKELTLGTVMPVCDFVQSLQIVHTMALILTLPMLRYLWVIPC